MSIREALSQADKSLRAAGVTDAAREAVWLLSHVLGCSVGTLLAQTHQPLTPEQSQEFDSLVARRAGREPLQYITGTVEFMGMSFHVTPSVLIPRPDTETLVRTALQRLHGPALIADIGTGSGAIAIAVARALPESRVVAIDISAVALDIARQNARALGVEDRIEFRLGDLLAPLAGESFNAILSNPPYIAEDEVVELMPEVRDWEPSLALSPGPDGLSALRALVVGAPNLLKPGGFLGLEVGVGQAQVVARLLRAAGLDVVIYLDDAGIERSLIGQIVRS